MEQKIDRKCKECTNILTETQKQFCSNTCAQRSCRKRKKQKSLCWQCSEPISEGSYCKKCLDNYREINKKCFSKNYRKRNRYLDQSKTLITSAKNRAKKRNLEFSITENDIKPLPQICPVFGIPLQRGIGRPHDNSLTVDRIDNKYGYTKENVAIISYRANCLKRDASLEELIRLVEYVATHKYKKEMKCVLGEKEDKHDNI